MPASTFLWLGFAALYLASGRTTWMVDVLRAGALSERGRYGTLLGPQHALGDAVPFAVWRALQGLGAEVDPLAVRRVVSALAAGAAVGVLFAGARRMGVARGRAAAAAVAFGLTAALWRGGGSGSVYGLAQLSAVLSIWATLRWVGHPDRKAAFVAGLAGGVAVATHLANAGAVVGLATALITSREGRDLRRIVTAATGAVVGFFVPMTLVASVAGAGGPVDWIRAASIGGPGDASAAVGLGLAGLGQAIIGWGSPLLALLPVALAAVALRREPVYGLGRAASASLLVNAATVFAMASWWQSLRLDYWGLGFAPLASLWAISPPRIHDPRGVAPTLLATTAILALGVGTAVLVVEPMQRLDAAVRTAAVAVEAAIPRSRPLIVQYRVAALIATHGRRASSAFGPLLATGRRGPATVDALLRREPDLVVAAGGSELRDEQLSVLGFRSASDLHEAFIEAGCDEPLGSYLSPGSGREEILLGCG